MKKLTAELVREHLCYDPQTGAFFRRQGKGQGRRPGGEKAGTLNKQMGYILISVGGRQYMAHRLAWLYVYGELPGCQIDHINGTRDDNRICNLRPASISEQRWNSCIRKRNTSGLKGVTWDAARKKWMAQIMAHRKKHNLGRFDTREEAHAAYQAASLKLHGDFARFN